jgi:outer membrane receptor protein involved in Fe transport
MTAINSQITSIAGMSIRFGALPGKRMRRAVAGLLACTALAGPLTAHASESADTPPAEASTSVDIVVTAQKHASTVQKTPASITAVGGDELKARGITSLANLAQGTPGVSLKSEGPSQTEIEMRGMTSSGGNSATVGFYIDDVPLTGPAGAQNGHVVIDPDLYDLNRIEILRGPQGTLFGSGSMGGTVRLITNAPDLTGLHASAQTTLSGTEGASFNHNDNVMINLPLVQDKLALRVVGSENFTSGWIDRIASNQFPYVDSTGTVRGNVAAAPISARYPGSNAYQVYAARASLLWQPTPNLSITPSFFFESSRQNGPSAYDSVSSTNSNPGAGLAHYQPFDIAEPLTDNLKSYSLTINYKAEAFEVTSSTSYWTRRSTQIEDASEAFNNPNTGVTLAANGQNNYINGVNYNGKGYYGPNGSGPESGSEVDPSKQFSEELRFASTGNGKLTWVGGLFYSHFQSLWTFNGTTPNYQNYMDLGNFLPATTPNWFDANSPTKNSQFAVFADASYALTSNLKADVGGRFNHSNYSFSSCITGWGSALGAATPSCTGEIKLSESSFNPKFNLSWTIAPDAMLYATAASGFRPGGGNAAYPTTPGTIWGTAFANMNFTGNQWPRTYKSDSVWSFELGEKARLFDRHLTANVSVYYEDWKNIQLEAYPNDWALNINGNHATLYGAEADISAVIGAGFQAQLSVGYVHQYLDGGPHWVIVPVTKLPEVAPVSGTAILSYAHPINDTIEFNAKIENTYTGVRYSLAFPIPYNANGAYIPMAAYDLTNIRAGVKFRDVWTASVFVNNVFNKHAQLESLYPENEGDTALNYIITNQPLTAGIDLSYRF